MSDKPGLDFLDTNITVIAYDRPRLVKNIPLRKTWSAGYGKRAVGV